MPHDLAALAADLVPVVAIIAIGLGTAAALAFFVVDANTQFSLGKDRDHACDQ